MGRMSVVYKPSGRIDILESGCARYYQRRNKEEIITKSKKSKGEGFSSLLCLEMKDTTKNVIMLESA